MNLTYAQTHWDSALVLFRQRCAWPARELADAAPLERLEQRLRLHLHVLARCPETAERQPAKTPDAFAWLASQLSSPDDQVRKTGYRRACQLLVEGGATGLGAFAALALFCPPEDDHCTLDLYRDHEQLRPILFSLWREQSFQVPPALYNRAELQGRNPDLQQAALAYAADNPNVSLELFRAYYQPLLGAARPVGVAAGVMCAALRGGLLRGDRDLPRALRRAIELETSPEAQLALLRIGALSGDSQIYPVLRSRLENHPQSGARLLALYGRPESLPDLLAALDKAPGMEPASSAWFWLTGQRLGRKPRLSLVGGEDQGATGETMPDSEAARNWLEQNRSGLADDARLFRGRPVGIPMLISSAQSLAGNGDADLLDLLAVRLQRPLGITAGAWRAVRTKILSQISTTSGNARTASSMANREVPRHV